MANSSNHNIHSRYIPLGYAIVWGIGLILSLWGYSLLPEDNYSESFIYLFSVFCVFVIFLGEIVLSFADTASIHESDRIKGTVFWVISRLFLILILTILFSFLFYRCEHILLLFSLIIIMCWLKWEISNLNNNMNKYVIKEEGFNIIANKFRL